MSPSYEFKNGKGSSRPQKREKNRDRDRAGGRDRERSRHHDRPYDRDRDHHRAGDRGFRGSGGGGDRYRPEHKFTFKGPRTASRPLLTRERETTPEYIGPVKDQNESTQKKFISLDEVSDSDEAEMEMSPKDNPGDREETAAVSEAEPPRKKQIRESSPPPSRPKWSNPDPYTVLPPEDDTQTHSKKKDIVKLIRKARVTQSTTSEGVAPEPEVTTPTVPQPQAQSQVKPEAQRPDSKPQSQPRSPEVANSNPVADNEDFISFDMEDLSAFMPPDSAPKGPKGRSDDNVNPRKRGYDEAMGGRTKKKGKSTIDGSILDEWRPRSRSSATPWLREQEAVSCIPATRFVRFPPDFRVKRFLTS